MLADEAVVIMGLLVGLNVVDCNLCVKVRQTLHSERILHLVFYPRLVGNLVDTCLFEWMFCVYISRFF